MTEAGRAQERTPLAGDGHSGFPGVGMSDPDRPGTFPAPANCA